MTIEGGLLALLKNDAGVAALVSTRVYAMHLPQNVTLPAISYQRVGAGRPHAMGSDPGIVASRFQFMAFGSTFDSARDVADAARAAISRYAGTQDSTVILGILLENELDVYNQQTDDYQSMLEAVVWYRE